MGGQGLCGGVGGGGVCIEHKVVEGHPLSVSDILLLEDRHSCSGTMGGRERGESKALGVFLREGEASVSLDICVCIL